MQRFNESDFFEEALAGRRGKLRYRLVIAAVLGIAFSTAGNWGWPLCWYVAYVGFQLADDRFLMWREGLSRERRAGWVLLPCLLLALSNILFIALGFPAPHLYGPWGVIAFGFLVGGISLYSVMSARASWNAFFAVFAPLAVSYVALPFLAYAHGGGTIGVIVTTAGAVLTIFASCSHWRDSAAVRIAERTARARAEAGEAAKTQFLAMVSHDLRTPLTAIRAGSERLAGRQVDAQTAEDARLIEDAATMMRRLLDDLLDRFKTEAGQMSVTPEPIDLNRDLTDLVRFWEPVAARKALTLSLDRQAAAPDWIMADPTRMRQILNNLLSNALKFTTCGGVTVVVDLDDDTIRIGVRDTGSGLDPEEAATLFQPYVQTASGIADGGGTGLGLVISRDLARQMGGDIICVETGKDRGATFILSLPLVICAAPEMKADSTTTVVPGLRVLIVDDHEINRRALTAILQAVGAETVTVDSGAAALESLSRDRFDVVLMDVHMPEMDGWETTRRLRAGTGDHGGTPVIAVTGSTSENDIRRCREAGMTDWVAKPVNACDLLTVLGRLSVPSAKAEAA